jgi:hypothetical protein
VEPIDPVHLRTVVGNRKPGLPEPVVIAHLRVGPEEPVGGTLELVETVHWQEVVGLQAQLVDPVRSMLVSGDCSVAELLVFAQ